MSNSVTEVFIMAGDPRVILEPLMENPYRRTLIVSDGDFSAFVDRPLSVGLLLVAALMLVGPHLPAVARRLRGSES